MKNTKNVKCNIRFTPKNTLVNTKYKSVNLLHTNAAGLKYKSNDLKNKNKFFKSSVFSIQETHFSKKGQFKMNNFTIFESIQKSKEKGGTLLGIHSGLKPVLVKEYSDIFELLVVEIEIKD